MPTTSALTIAQPMTTAKAVFLSSVPVTLPKEHAGTTDVLAPAAETWIEKLLRRAKQGALATRVKQVRQAMRLFRAARGYAGVVTCGDLEGLTFAMLQRLRGAKRPTHVMFDCLWYGGGYFKREWMRYCLRQVDCCVVWASIEIDRYSKVYETDRSKFLFVPHHHTAKKYRFEVGDDGYVFTGGNWSRDYKLFIDAVRDLKFPCVLATTRAHDLLAGIDIPANVRIVAASHEEFRQLIAKASIVVLPMQANELHAGGQQTFLNAMLMGKPVVLTDPEGGRDYIQDGVDGRLIAYGDRDQLRTAIAELMSDSQLRKSMGEAAKRSATPLTTEACNARIWQELEDLVQRRKSS